MLIYGSVCSGIEAASMAWEPLGWRPSFFSEIDPFPRALLETRWPGVPVHGDFTTIKKGQYRPIDLLVGGTPCQSFSVAGLRGGLDDNRGNLALEYLRLADRLRPQWLVWENVPGVLSSNEGRDFGSILGGMVELGYGFAYRVLDAQYFGVAQRRRRVFVVGCLGDWRPAAAVLFERHSLQGHPAPSRKAGERPAPTISARTSGGGGLGTDFDLDGGLIQWPATVARGGETRGQDPVIATYRMTAFGEYADDGTASTLKQRDFKDSTDLIAHTLRGSGFDASEDGSGRGTPIIAVHGTQDPDVLRDMAHTLGRNNGQENAIVYTPDGASTIVSRSSCGQGQTNSPGYNADQQVVAYSIMPMNSGKDYKAREVDIAQPLMTTPVSGSQGGDYVVQTLPITFNMHKSGNDGSSLGVVEDRTDCLRAFDKSPFAVQTYDAVRRLTPEECERLQGFPDHYTRIPWKKKPESECPDGPRYKALGNSMAVPVMHWIGKRIAAVDAILKERAS
jgi:DNA (cytosine-5)-methyltransferase 1